MDINTSIQEIQDELIVAMRIDLESGADWLNEKAAAEFVSKYPTLSEILTNILEIANESN